MSGNTQLSEDTNTAQPPHLRRVLKTRHLTMIAVGGAIGSGLFIASGASIAQAGPGGALLSYLLIGIMVYFLMTSLGELAAYMPESGSFATYGAKYVDEGFGFALGWNYWYNWAVTVAVDLAAAQLVVKYWFPHSPEWVGFLWVALFLTIIFLLNYVSVKGFGEAEYWFALIKVVTVLCFLGVGIAMIFGILHGGEQAGWHNFTIGEAPFKGGVLSMIGVAMIVGFSFQGTELIGVAAGESENPRKNIPRAVKQVFWRILLFYVLAILIIGVLIPYTNTQLLNNTGEDISLSPFTIVFKNAGLLFAAGVMNAVILTSVLSAGNSGMYASTRMLYSLAREGKAPRIFAELSSNGTPRNALVLTVLVCIMCFVAGVLSKEGVFFWLVQMSGMTGFIAWLGIAISHYRFRKGYVRSGLKLSDLPYRAKFFPFGPLFAFALCIIIMLGQKYDTFIDPHFSFSNINWVDMAGAYIGIPLFFVIWAGYRVVKGGRIVRYDEMRFVKGDDGM